MPEDSEFPDDATRKALTKAIPIGLQYCQSMHVVIEGDGIRAVLMRTLTCTMRLIAGEREKVRYHATLEEALDSVDGHLRDGAASVLQKAYQKGLVTPKPK